MSDIRDSNTLTTADGASDRRDWEPITDRSILPAHPTVFTWSVLAPTLREAYRRTAGQMNPPWPTDGPLFDLVAGHPYQRYGLQLAADGETSGPGAQMTVWELGSQGSRALETLLSAAAEQDTRLGRWYDRVRQTHWGQADLLQVMEEIESLGVGVQAAWMQLRLTRRAATARVQQWQQTVWPDAAAPQVAALTGHASPYAATLAQAAAGGGAATRASLLTTYRHRGPDEVELAAPRWAEVAPGETFAWPAAIQPEWADLMERQRSAEQTLVGRASFFKRRGLEADVQRRRRIAEQLAAVDDARARWLAGTRIWAVAAAQEAVADGRITDPADIFLLELEEVKQLMTGEWNIAHRTSLHELLAERRREFARAV